MDDDPLESRWSSNLKKLDMFSQEIEILFENNRRTLQTHCGVVFGFFMVFLLMAYGAFKTSVMISYEQVNIQQPDFKGHFSLEEPFDHDLGWRIAFGFTAYDSSSMPEPLTDSYGKLTAYQKVWGEVDAQGNSLPTYMRPLKTRPCEADDIDFDEDNNTNRYFFKPASEYASDVRKFYDKL